MRKILWSLIVLAFVISGCSSNEVDEVISENNNPEAINFKILVTKSNISTIENVKKGFMVYASNGGSTPKWYFGPQTYKREDDIWKWAIPDANLNETNITQWPVSEKSYPLNFYAFYPRTPTNFKPNASTPGKLIASIRANDPKHIVDSKDVGYITLNQPDYLAAKVTAIAKPESGYLSLTFKHIMSKINAAIIPGFKKKVYVQSVMFQGLYTVNTYDYVSQSWLKVFERKDTATYANKGGKGYSVPADTKAYLFTGTDSGEKTAIPIYGSASHKNNLMLIPQELNPWNKTFPVSGAYIEVIYRVTNVDGTDLIGITETSTCSIPGWNGNPTSVYRRPLFVKVGFPLAANWIEGKGYTYNIKLGTVDTTGGIYLQDTYVDENGKDTLIKIKDRAGKEVKPGDTVNQGVNDFTVGIED